MILSKLFVCWVKSNIPTIQYNHYYHPFTSRKFSISCNHELQRCAKRIRPFYRISNGQASIGDRCNKRSFTPLATTQAFKSYAGNRSPTSFDTDSFKILVDNCATRSITNDSADFIDPPVKVKGRLKGVAGSMPVTCKGTVRWYIEDDSGTVHKILLPNTLFVPSAPERLLSPQHWAQARRKRGDSPDGTIAITYSDRVELHWDRQQFCRTILLDSQTNVAHIYSAPGYTKFRTYRANFDSKAFNTSEQEFFHSQPDSLTNSEGETDIDSSDHSDESHVNTISDAAEELVPESNLEINLNNIDVAEGQEIHRIDEDVDVIHNNPQAELLRWHYRLGHLSFKTIRAMAANGTLPKRLLDCQVPKCSSCMYGKLHRKPWRTKIKKNVKPISSIEGPGDCISVDQLESRTPGFIAQMKGRLTKHRYECATVFVDHFSRLSYVYPMRSITAAETVEAKKHFERFCATHHVKVKHYHADNGRFAENLFMQAVRDAGQTISFCAAYAHFQNGIAEKMIRDLQEQARTQLLHAKARWPESISANLWPQALRCANAVRNINPTTSQSESPLEKFTGVKIATQLKHQHTFGCPVYALNSKLQSGTSIPKWDSRARLGIYLGPSPNHARSVSLVMDPNSGLVSPQFHVYHDDFFETVGGNNPKTVSLWQKLSGFKKNAKLSLNNGVGNPNSVQTPAIPSEQPSEGADPHPNEAPDLPPEGDDPALPDPPLAAEDQAPPPAEISETPVRRSSRVKHPTRRFLESIQQGSYIGLESVADQFYDDDFELIESLKDPIAFKASSDPDTLYLHQALKQKDRDKFIDAMVKEVRDHESRYHWRVIKRTEVPEGHKVLPAVWAMRRKRRIQTKEVYKWKARLNLHGGKQEHGVNYWETYSPVVDWAAIRLCMILSIINNWISVQIDFVLAFPQAPIECKMYMEVPHGFEVEGAAPGEYVLLLLKNLYGQKQAGRVWFEHLRDGLTNIGFKQSKLNECVFVKDKVVLTIYVDDGILFGKRKKDISNIIDLLKRNKFDIEEMGDVCDYIGVKVERLSNGQIKLSQPHLIDQILTDLNFDIENTKTKDIPALSSKLLDRDLEGNPFEEKWQYRSIIGKLNYLEKCTRGDIAFAVHQCARFSQDPKKSHADAVRQIARYLAGTRTQGLILNPSNKSFECYADAGFSGDWNKATAPFDVSTARSRTGYTTMYAGCPLTWLSRLQTEIAQSTCEAEYISLSAALKEVIFLMDFLKELSDLGLPINSTKASLNSKAFKQVNVYCDAYEDNSAALEMAKVPKMRPRTRHLNIKYHHFREHVRRGHIKVHAVDTKNQIADIFTKALPKEDFVRHRKALLGW